MKLVRRSVSDANIREYQALPRSLQYLCHL